MSGARRALLWALVVALFTVIAVMATGEPGEQIDTTPTTWFSGNGDLTEVHP